MPELTVDAVELETSVGPHGGVLLPDDAELLAHVDLLAPGELALAPPQGLNNLGLQRAGSEGSLRRDHVKKSKQHQLESSVNVI